MKTEINGKIYYIRDCGQWMINTGEFTKELFRTYHKGERGWKEMKNWIEKNLLP